MLNCSGGGRGEGDHQAPNAITPPTPFSLPPVPSLPLSPANTSATVTCENPPGGKAVAVYGGDGAWSEPRGPTAREPDHIVTFVEK